jgi:hypothetical protein
LLEPHYIETQEDTSVDVEEVHSPKNLQDIMDIIQVTGTVKFQDLYISSRDVGLTNKLKPSDNQETDGLVSELTEEDIEPQPVSVTESPVLEPYSSEDKDTSVPVDTPKESSPKKSSRYNG